MQELLNQVHETYFQLVSISSDSSDNDFKKELITKMNEQLIKIVDNVPDIIICKVYLHLNMWNDRVQTKSFLDVKRAFQAYLLDYDYSFTCSDCLLWQLLPSYGGWENLYSEWDDKDHYKALLIMLFDVAK